LFLRADGNPRHHVPNMGVLYLVNLPLLLLGAYKLVENKPKNSSVIWLFLLTGPLAASLTASTPHAIRGYSMLPGFILISAYGVSSLIQLAISHKPLSKSNLYITSYSLFLISNFFYYLNLYYVIYPYKDSKDWQYGYKQVVDQVTKSHMEYDQIIVTNHYDQPHIFFAFYQQIDPIEYQTYAQTAHQQIANISFKTIQSEDFQSPNSLIVVESERTPTDANIIQKINFLNGDTAFNFVSTN
jgi:hypothetical protein